MRRVAMAVALLAVGVVVPVAGAQVAQADGPGVGAPWVVSLGDSYISGEGGRWAGNSNNSSSSVDAGGSAAYFDNATRTAEVIARLSAQAGEPNWRSPASPRPGTMNAVSLSRSSSEAV